MICHSIWKELPTAGSADCPNMRKELPVTAPAVRRGTRWTGTVLCCLILSIAIAFSSYGAWDPSREGTLTVNAALVTEESTRSPVSGVEFSVYQIAAAVVRDGNLYFVPADPLSEYEEELNVSLRSDSGDLAEIFAKRIQKAGGVDSALFIGSKMSDSDGNAEFSVTPGAYLVVQSNVVTGYSSVCPFLAVLPVMSEDGTEWEYQVRAMPKITHSLTTTEGGGGHGSGSSGPGGNGGSVWEHVSEVLPEELLILPPELPLSILPQTGLHRGEVWLFGMGGVLCLWVGQSLAGSDISKKKFLSGSEKKKKGGSDT